MISYGWAFIHELFGLKWAFFKWSERLMLFCVNLRLCQSIQQIAPIIHKAPCNFPVGRRWKRGHVGLEWKNILRCSVFQVLILKVAFAQGLKPRSQLNICKFPFPPILKFEEIWILTIIKIPSENKTYNSTWDFRILSLLFLS